VKMAELLDRLKEGKIMAAIVNRDGTSVDSNFTMNEGLEGYIASSFNVGDSFLREVGEEAGEIVVSTDKGNIVIKDIGDGTVLLAQILTKEQYALYKKVVAGGSAAPKKKETAAEEKAAPKKAAKKGAATASKKKGKASVKEEKDAEEAEDTEGEAGEGEGGDAQEGETEPEGEAVKEGEAKAAKK
jgi:predicted regulator of Ras-like GTPase activity (Roadblock/LC7/MglB family)